MSPVVVWSFAVAWVLVAPTTRAEGGLVTEADAIARAVGRAAWRDLEAAQVQAELARSQADNALPSPELAYEREQIGGSGASHEDSVRVAQVLDLGKRSLLRDAGRARGEATREAMRAAQNELVSEVRLRFYDVLYGQARQASLEEAVRRIDALLQWATEREARGEGSSHERRRIARERLVAETRLEVERAQTERMRGRLEALTGPVGGISGTVLPEDAPPPLPEAQASVTARGDIKGLDRRIHALALEEDAASRWWLPELRVEAGWKGVDTGLGTEGHGFVVGLGVELPLWGPAQGLARVAAADGLGARAERELLTSELAAEIAGAHAAAMRLHTLAARVGATLPKLADELIGTATAAHAGGELDLFGLIDAHRTQTEDALEALGLAHEARVARITLDRLTGMATP